MQIVIDIPEETYKQIMEFGFLENTHGKICYKAIKNGTVLPKHGRLGDLDALEQYVIDKYSEGEQLAIDISDAPTVLKADNETNAQ